MPFPERLKALRKKAGLTQTKLGELIGVSLLTVFRWENGERSPRMDNIKKIAEVLHVSDAELLSEQQYENHSWVLQIKIAHDFREEMFDLSKGVPHVASITTTRDGGLLTLGGSYDVWTNDNCFKKLLQDLKKFRATVIQNGVSLGGIKQN